MRDNKALQIHINRIGFSIQTTEKLCQQILIVMYKDSRKKFNLQAIGSREIACQVNVGYETCSI